MKEKSDSDFKISRSPRMGGSIYLLRVAALLEPKVMVTDIDISFTPIVIAVFFLYVPYITVIDGHWQTPCT
jgi:hypothetical protein